MTTPTELRNLILETIGQLGKFIDVMSEYEGGYSVNDVKLLGVLHSYANQAKQYGKNLIAGEIR